MRFTAIVALALSLCVCVWSKTGAADGPQNGGTSAVLQSHQTPNFATVRTNVVVTADPALFAVLAAINVGGYDSGLDAAATGPLRRKIRDQILAKGLPIFGELRLYYAAHKKPDPAADLAQYISLALLIGPPPTFKLSLPVADLPPDASGVQDFLPLLRRFYDTAGVEAVWRQYQPIYEAAIDRYAPQIRQVMNGVDDYFRLPQTFLGRQLFVIPEVLAAPGQTDARNYLDNYFIVVNLEMPTQIDDIRHTYLHYVLEPLVSKYPGALDRAQPLLPLVARAPALSPQFKNSVPLFYTECLVRAVEARLSRVPGETAAARDTRQEARVREDMSEGLVLTQFFYDQLKVYEKDIVNFSEFYPSAAYALDVNHIQGMTRKMAFIAAPLRPEPVQPQPLVGLLESGEAKLQANDLAGAQALAESALRDPHGDHATAHFLLAEAAARQGNSSAATSDFESALAEAPPAAAHVRTWCNIYLGRILDLEDQREEAVAHYRAALATADSPGARTLAQQGLERPFVSAHPHTPVHPN